MCDTLKIEARQRLALSTLRRAAGAVVLSAAAAAPLRAQSLAQLQPGVRVSIMQQVDSTCARRWRACATRASATGTLVRVTSDSLVLAFRPGSELAVSLGRGRRSTSSSENRASGLRWRPA